MPEFISNITASIEVVIYILEKVELEAQLAIVLVEFFLHSHEKAKPQMQ